MHQCPLQCPATHVRCEPAPRRFRPLSCLSSHPERYCWRTLSVCSLSTAWRGLGQESSGGALQRPPPFGFASSILKDVAPASLPLDVGQFLRYLAVSHAKHIHATHMPATPVSICPIVLPASDVAIFMCDHLLGLENGIRR